MVGARPLFSPCDCALVHPVCPISISAISAQAKIHLCKFIFIYPAARLLRRKSTRHVSCAASRLDQFSHRQTIAKSNRDQDSITGRISCVRLSRQARRSRGLKSRVFLAPAPIPATSAPLPASWQKCPPTVDEAKEDKSLCRSRSLPSPGAKH